MLESRWGRRAGPGIAALGALLAIATTTLGAPTVEGRPPPPCDATTPAAADTLSSPAWYRLDPVLADGALVGQRLEIGRTDGPTWAMALDPESFATAPAGGRVVVGTDDGRRSTVSLVDTARGCLQSVVTTPDAVIRRAILEPDGRAIVEHRIRRTDRTDLGIWRRPLSGDAPTRILAPIEPDPAFGRTWSTDLVWSDDGRS